MEFSRPEYWSGGPIPSPGDLPNPGIKLESLVLQTESLPTELSGKPRLKLSSTQCVSADTTIINNHHPHQTLFSNVWHQLGTQSCVSHCLQGRKKKKKKLFKINVPTNHEH